MRKSLTQENLNHIVKKTTPSSMRSKNQNPPTENNTKKRTSFKLSRSTRLGENMHNGLLTPRTHLSRNSSWRGWRREEIDVERSRLLSALL
jgi:hypothetical protein